MGTLRWCGCGVREPAMSEERDPIPLQFGVNIAQLDMIDGFQHAKGLASREAAIRLLLDIALETVTGTGRRFWDKPLIGPETSQTNADQLAQARELADRLRAQGHLAAAERVHHATAGARMGRALLEALREACQTALTQSSRLTPRPSCLRRSCGLRWTNG